MHLGRIRLSINLAGARGCHLARTCILVAGLQLCNRSKTTIQVGGTYTPFTLALLIRSETGFAPMRAFTLHQLIRINDLIRIKLNHLLEVVSHRFSLLRVLIASVDTTGTIESKRSKSDEINARCCIRSYGVQKQCSVVNKILL